MTAAQERRLRARQGCLTECVAFYFNVHPETVPLFLDRGSWVRRLKAFYHRRGFRARWRATRLVPKRGTHIVCGDSRIYKHASHAVVYRNGRLRFDSNYPSTWNRKAMTHRLVVQRLKKERA